MTISTSKNSTLIRIRTRNSTVEALCDIQFHHKGILLLVVLRAIGGSLFFLITIPTRIVLVLYFALAVSPTIAKPAHVLRMC